MGSQAPSVGLIVGVLAALAVGAAVAQGVVLSVESLPVAAAAGLLVGILLGALATVLIGGSDLAPGTRRVAVAATVFAVVALALFLGISSAGIANVTALLAGVGVAAIVGIGSYVYLRDQDAQQVQAVTM